MIILDTNVISELTRPVPDSGVISWLDSLPAEETAITAITAAELRYGVSRMPDGRRKTELSEAVNALINADFRNRVEPFDVLECPVWPCFTQQSDKGTPRQRLRLRDQNGGFCHGFYVDPDNLVHARTLMWVSHDREMNVPSGN